MSKSFFARLCPLVLATLFFAPSAALAADVTRLVPNDTFYNHQWYMDYIKAPEAWAKPQVTSTRDVVVAMVDAGVDFSHPDLQGVLWTNPDEIANGKDDDNDGLVDDIHGWNYVTNSPDTRPVDNGVIIDNGAWEHGTAIASLIAGRGNNDIGMAGVAWKAKIMPLVILGSDGSGATDSLAKAIRYAVDHRADIINLSLEGDSEDPDVSQAIKEATAKGVLVVVAAGNGNGEGNNLDLQPLYPSCHTGAAGQGMLVVSAIQEDGSRNPSSNYGSCVSLAAPGADIMAARPTYEANGNRKDVSGYGVWSGTSMAAPLVSGSAAMLKIRHPGWTGEQLAQRLLATAQPFTKGIDQQGMGQGVLDVASAVAPASDEKYGPWNLWASNPGALPSVWITSQQGKVLFSFTAGDATDKRGLHAIFVRWGDDRRPNILVTYQGDESGAWRLYRWDGVLLSMGQVSQNAQDKIQGGLLLAAQDLKAQAKEMVLLTEATGPRAWRFESTTNLGKSFVTTLDEKSYGSMAVGIQRPIQAMTLLSRSMPYSSLRVLQSQGIGEDVSVTTTRPSNLNMVEGQTADGREVIRLVQSGKPTYLIERKGMLDVTTDPIAVAEWRQAPLGLEKPNMPGKFYDFWPR
ncbi:MAG: S8 family serine peptidase [Patescibacteria group bacterium]|nr:S8 family serine peptidase [Patescibacteria group bacterium]